MNNLEEVLDTLNNSNSLLSEAYDIADDYHRITILDIKRTEFSKSHCVALVDDNGELSVNEYDSIEELEEQIYTYSIPKVDFDSIKDHCIRFIEQVIIEENELL